MTEAGASRGIGDVDFVIPTKVGRVGIRRLRTATVVSVDGVTVATLPDATFREPWREVRVVGDDRLCLVVSRFGPVEGSTVEEARLAIFDGGVNVDDGRTIVEWRASTPPSRDDFEAFLSGERYPAFRSYRLGWLAILLVTVALCLFLGLPLLAARASLLFIAIPTMFESMRIIDSQLRGRPGVNPQLRVLAHLALMILGFAVAFGLLLYAVSAVPPR